MASPLSSATMTDCQKCQRRRRPSLVPGLCIVCFRRIEFEKLPPEQQRDRFSALVHARYVDAEIEDLPGSLGSQLVNSPDTESIYLWGPPGTGKTYAFAAMAKRYVRMGFNVQRETWERLCLRIRDTFNPRATETEWGIVEPYLRADKLILEDIGTTVSTGRQETDFAVRVLLLILDSRNEDCLQTLITGNKPVNELERSFDARIASRLRQGTIIAKTGRDRRASDRG